MSAFFTSFFILPWGALGAGGGLGIVLGAARADMTCLGGVLGSCGDLEAVVARSWAVLGGLWASCGDLKQS